MKGWVVTISLCMSLALASCGGGSDSSTGSTTAASSAGTPINAEGPGPAIKLPGGAPPKKVVVKDLKKGSGTKAKVGYRVALRYIGVRWTGEEYSNSWTYDTPPEFVLGAGELTMHGLDEGIRGMRVGGRREIILPPSARYGPGEPGPKPQHGKYPPSETLVYVVDLLKARPDFKSFRVAKTLRGS
jgi:peptidylprolyl isomerase